MRNNVGLFLAKRAMLSPNMEGFVDADTGRRYTFAEWNARCNRVADVAAPARCAEGRSRRPCSR